MADLVGNNNTLIEVTCIDQDRAAIDLTGSSVDFIFRANGGAATTKTMTITNAAGGVCEYRLANGEAPSNGGLLTGEVEITDAAGFVYKNREPMVFTVRSIV